MSKRFVPLLIVLFLSLKVQTQISFNTDSSVVYYIEEILLGGNVEIDNPRYFGSKFGIANFSADKFLIEEGLILSTGNVHNITNVNKEHNTSSPLFVKGSYDLYKITNRDNFDASAIEFDFKPDFDSFYFNFVFASEEYEEFVGTRYNDVFAFFLYEHGKIQDRMNLARVPGTRDIVSINSINPKKNKELYISNCDYKKESGYNIEYDGFTRVMSAGAKLIPGRWYRIKLVIADVNDQKYDSGVLIEKGSFRSIPSKQKNTSKITTGKFYENIEFKSDSFNIPLTYLDFLDEIIKYLVQNDDMIIEIVGHTDNTGSFKYNVELSEKRAEEVAYYLIDNGVAEERVSWGGRGSRIAIATNETSVGRAKNRRIEFNIHKK